jgi:hypothetical protein
LQSGIAAKSIVLAGCIELALGKSFEHNERHLMNTRIFLASIAALALSLEASAADKYQVTGPVVELTDKTIVVEKGTERERHEFVRSADTKVNGELKVGSTVTVMYIMTATSVEVKAGKPAK